MLNQVQHDEFIKKIVSKQVRNNVILKSINFILLPYYYQTFTKNTPLTPASAIAQHRSTSAIAQHRSLEGNLICLTSVFRKYV